jgi:2,3-dihydroxyphenylpropionate 1,2-dioxygenase
VKFTPLVTALGGRKPDIVSMDPSWHHNYASLGWTGAGPALHDAHCPAIRPELVELTAALHGLAHQQDERERYVADAAAYAKSFKLTAEQEKALLDLDLERMVAMGAHPLVPFLARMQIQRMRRG